jgi:spermidine/putrescine transport system substrate-binding protein
LNTGIVLLIFAVFGGLFVWMIISKINKYRRKNHRKYRRRRR